MKKSINPSSLMLAICLFTATPSMAQNTNNYVGAAAWKLATEAASYIGSGAWALFTALAKGLAIHPAEYPGAYQNGNG